MGETRDPALGHWSVFEADTYKTGKETSEFPRSVNTPIEWPVTLRVHYIRDGVMRSRDVEIDEQLEVKVCDLQDVNIR